MKIGCFTQNYRADGLATYEIGPCCWALMGWQPPCSKAQGTVSHAAQFAAHRSVVLARSGLGMKVASFLSGKSTEHLLKM